MKLPTKVALGSGCSLMMILVFKWITFPNILKFAIKSQVCLKPGTQIRDIFLKFPFSLDFKVFIFNVTNPDAVQAGEYPVMEEIGPFVYTEWKTKVDVVDIESEDAMEYNPVDTFIFDEEKSSPLTGDEIVTIPNPLIVGVINTAAVQKPALLSIVGKAINVIFKNPTSIFLSVKAKDLLFNGVLVNCTVKDFAAKAVCTQIKAEAPGLEWITATDFLFSFLRSRNATEQKRLKVRRGIKVYRDVGRIIEFDGQRELKVWNGIECNRVSGTDATVFPPLINNGEGVVTFSSDICRSIEAVYVEPAKYNGIPVNRYEARLGDMSTDENLKCLCPTPQTCLGKGLTDISTCGQPVVASLPHFYDTDGTYLKQIKGLSPRKEKHRIDILFEPYTGNPVYADKRMQFNLPLKPYKKIPLMKNLPQTLVPLMWIEETFILNSTYTAQMKMVYMAIKTANVSTWFVAIASVAGFGAAGYLYYKNDDRASITPEEKVHPAEKEARKSAVSVVDQRMAKNEKLNKGT